MKSFQRSNHDVEVVETRDMDYVEFIVESATDIEFYFLLMLELL